MKQKTPRYSEFPSAREIIPSK